MTLARVFQDAALLLLGLFTGAMLVIGVSFVGYWQSLEPSAFLNWFAANAGRIGGLMLPLGAAATLAALGSAAVTWSSGDRARWWSTASAVLTVSILVVYFVVHAPRNAAFSSGGLPPERVTGELAAWARWHWVRVLLAVAAFWTQLVAIRARSSSASA
jgi:Anthrone oxygenase